DHPENGKWSLEDLQARLDQAWFKSEDFLVAESGGRMVGFNWLKQVPAPPPHRAEGEIYIIGVGSSERGHGLGRILALLGLYRLGQRGMNVCTLYVEDDNRPALGLYYRLGFTIRHVHRCYAVPVDSALPRKRTFIRSGRAEGP
ncbi:MAG TPA: GNAT family N-acetyltransferase, partial [Chloroflexota bacterium]|nr:GNAT family N-acetyltransferase [Chloroflexota bacterium]